MPAQLTVSGTVEVSAATLGDLPQGEITMPLQMKDALPLTVTQQTHGTMTVASTDFVAVPLGGVTAGLFLALQVDGGAVKLRFNGAGELYVDGLLVTQFPSGDHALTELAAALPISTSPNVDLEFLAAQ
ncbi:MAG: hypothetical protein C4523_17695 [Myxococcales bacterium]|nr:MAG: hypothetical protein C4523_17695 [Myxococcales bacterium]